MMLGDAAPGATHGLCRTIAWDLCGVAPALEGNIRSSGRTLTWLADLVGTDVATLLSEAARRTPATSSSFPASAGSARRGGGPLPRARRPASNSGRVGRSAPAAVDAVVRQVEDVLSALEEAAGRPDVCSAMAA